jgi:hypothetical protein
VEWLLAIVFVEIKEKRKKMATVDEKCEVFVVKLSLLSIVSHLILRILQTKMRNEGLSDAAIQAFAYSYRELVSGQSGMILESSITPVDHLPDLDSDIKGTVTRDTNLLQVTTSLHVPFHTFILH